MFYKMPVGNSGLNGEAEFHIVIPLYLNTDNQRDLQSLSTTPFIISAGRTLHVPRIKVFDTYVVNIDQS